MLRRLKQHIADKKLQRLVVGLAFDIMMEPKVLWNDVPDYPEKTGLMFAMWKYGPISVTCHAPGLRPGSIHRAQIIMRHRDKILATWFAADWVMYGTSRKPLYKHARNIQLTPLAYELSAKGLT